MTGCRRVLEILQGHREELAEFGVRHLFVYGSVARGDETPESDVDLLVEFDRPVGLFHFVRLRDLLAELLGRDVDLVSLDALDESDRRSVLGEAVRAA